MEETSELSFGDLLKIRDTVGSKAFHNALSKSEVQKNDAIERPGSDVKDSRQQRRNKNQPIEITSKKPTSRKRIIINTEVKPRDPRFDSLAGHYNPELFDRSYGFLNDLQKSELLEKKMLLKKKKKECGGEDEAVEMLKADVNKLESKINHIERTKLQKIHKRSWKKKEAELVKKGKTPYFVKKSVINTQNLISKFKTIPADQIDKVLEKKRKRNAAKQQVKIPSKRRSAQIT